MQKILAFFRGEVVLAAALVLALLSFLLTPPSAAAFASVDVSTLCMLFALMAVVAGLRSCGLFDYMFDADAVVRDPDRPDCYNDRYHQGDHLHPSQVGGDALAAAYDLEQLTGEK